MNIPKFLSIVLSISFLTGCLPEVGAPDDFLRHSKLVEKGKLIPNKEIIEWLGEPERVIKVSNILSETKHFRNYKEFKDKETAEADAQFTMDSWYQRYADANGISIEVNSKWSSDDAFLDSSVWCYYFENPLEIKVAYRTWIGVTKQAKIKKSLFFLKIDEKGFSAVPSLKRK